MSTDASSASSSSTVPPTKTPPIVWVGRVITALPLIGLVMSAGMKLSHSPEIVEAFGKFGYAESTIMPIGVVELLCVILCAVPQTGVDLTLSAAIMRPPPWSVGMSG